VTTTEDREYLPAMSRHMPLAFYDAFTRLLGARDAHWRLIAQAGIEPGSTVLEIGCGTGNVLLLAAHAVPRATLIGLDPDAKVLAIAARKARRAGVNMRLDQGYADQLPYPDGSVDRVLSAFMLHHLPLDQQRAALREVHRVLAPGGRLHLLDIDGSPASTAGRLLRLGHVHTAEHGHQHGHDAGPHAHADPDTALAALEQAGLVDATVVAHGAMPLGGFSFYRAAR
jgi:ubiquinone/menaquinone biosynthesis C-methylase UbiE